MPQLRRLRTLCAQLPGSNATSTTEITTFERNQRYVTPAPDAQFYHEAPASTQHPAEQTEAAVPRPALTPGERLHLEINGYVVVREVFSKAECDAMIARIFEIEQALHASADPSTWTPHPASHMQGRSHEFFRVDNLPHVSR